MKTDSDPEKKKKKGKRNSGEAGGSPAEAAADVLMTSKLSIDDDEEDAPMPMRAKDSMCARKKSQEDGSKPSAGIDETYTDDDDDEEKDNKRTPEDGMVTFGGPAPVRASVAFGKGKLGFIDGGAARSKTNMNLDDVEAGGTGLGEFKAVTQATDDDEIALIEMLSSCKAPLFEFEWPAHVAARMLRDFSLGDSHTSKDELTGEFTVSVTWLSLNGCDWNLVAVLDREGKPLPLLPDTEVQPGMHVTFLCRGLSTMQGYSRHNVLDQELGDKDYLVDLEDDTILDRSVYLCRNDQTLKAKGKIRFEGDSSYFMLEGSRLVKRDGDIMTFEYRPFDRVHYNLSGEEGGQGGGFFGEPDMSMEIDVYMFTERLVQTGKRLGLELAGIAGLDLRAKHRINVSGVVKLDSESRKWEIEWCPPPETIVQPKDVCLLLRECNKPVAVVEGMDLIGSINVARADGKKKKDKKDKKEKKKKNDDRAETPSPSNAVSSSGPFCGLFTKKAKKPKSPLAQPSLCSRVSHSFSKELDKE